MISSVFLFKRAKTLKKFTLPKRTFFQLFSKTSKATTICPGSYKCYPSQSFEIGEIGALKKLLEHACQDRFSFVLWISVLVCASNQNMPNCACILKIFL